VYNEAVRAVHVQILEAARRIADRRRGWTFQLAALVRAVPHLNAATVRTHVSSRCCVNAPPHHQSRHAYFRALSRGRYRVEPRFRGSARRVSPQDAWQDRVIAALGSGVDDTLISESLAMTPTERLETMRRAAASLEAMRRR
jgi:hypothetical protein